MVDVSLRRKVKKVPSFSEANDHTGKDNLAAIKKLAVSKVKSEGHGVKFTSPPPGGLLGPRTSGVAAREGQQKKIQKMIQTAQYGKNESHEVVVNGVAGLENGHSGSLPVPRRKKKKREMSAADAADPAGSYRHSIGRPELSTTIAGGVIGQCPVVFSADSGFFFCAVSSQIKMFSVSTGLVVRILSSTQPSAHSGLVTGLHLNPKNRYQLYSAGLDGNVKVWDVNDGSLLKTTNFHFPITRFEIYPGDHSKFILLMREDEPTSELQDSRSCNNLSRHRVVISDIGGRPRAVARDFGIVGFAVRDQILVIAFTTRYAVFDLGQSGVSGNCRSFESSGVISTIAIHPLLSIVATGLTTGEIELHHHASLTLQNPPATTIMHWHAHNVRCLSFSPDGAYILSGGEEAVLLTWQLETGHCNHLPRLGGCVNSISWTMEYEGPEAEQFVGVVIGNVGVRIFSAINFAMRQAVVGIGLGASLRLSSSKGSNEGRRVERERELERLKAAERQIAKHSYPSTANARCNAFSPRIEFKLTVHPRSGLLVIPSAVGGVSSLQFFNALEDKHVMEIATVPRNKVMSTENFISERGIKFVAFSGDGIWMVTVDVESDSGGSLQRSGGGGEVDMKIWEFDEPSQSYAVNTRMSSPHSGDITLCVLSPIDVPGLGGPLLVTAGTDSNFRTWTLVASQTNRRLQNADRSAGPARYWSTRSVGTYRSRAFKAAAFSPDASVLALATDVAITLWDPITATMRFALAFPDIMKSVSSNGDTFFRGDDGRWIVTATADSVLVWNLLTVSCWWAMPNEGWARPVSVQPGANSDEFVVTYSSLAAMEEGRERFSSHCVVAIFTVHSPAPVRWYNITEGVQAVAVLRNADQPFSSDTESGRSRLIALTYLNEIKSLGWTSVAEPKSSVQCEQLGETAKQGRLSKIYGADVQRKMPSPAQVPTSSSINVVDASQSELVDGVGSVGFMTSDSHVIPPPSMVVGIFLEMSIKYLSRSSHLTSFELGNENREEKEECLKGDEWDFSLLRTGDESDALQML